MRKFLGKLFSKTTLIVFILLIELIALVLLAIYASLAFWWSILAFNLLGIIFAIIIVNNHTDISYKIAWLFLIVVNSLIGISCYLLFGDKKATKKQKKFSDTSEKELQKALETKVGAGAIEELNNSEDLGAYRLCNYLRDYSNNSTYRNSSATYFGFGEDGFSTMLEKLRSAKHYIFLEYFIVQPGKMWDSILEILLSKAKEGVDIRMLYDDFGCIRTLPRHYDKYLQKQGINCYKVNKLRPVLDISMNNRDHRKIMVIDGCIGFTGGVNLADEYINEINRFGRWKDNIIMIEGDAVFGLTSLFLSAFAYVYDGYKSVNYLDYLPNKYSLEHKSNIRPSGYIAPYGSAPTFREPLGMNVYLSMILRAKKYIYITTPYLILNDELSNAICMASKNGVDVRIITPHIPDKKNVFQLTRSYYGKLLKCGVKIYEYLPGFIHQKICIVDGIAATVGSVNFDYRSFFLHFENGTVLYKCDVIKDIEEDFIKTLQESINYTSELYSHTRWYTHLYRSILRVIAPLL